jgi:Spy/CpxP family protein refolding chaperone
VIAQPMECDDCEPMAYHPQTMNRNMCVMRPDDMMSRSDMLCKQNPKEMVETIRIYKITEELDLSEDQSVRFFPKLKEMRTAHEEYIASRRRLSEQLEGYLKDPNKFAKDIKSLVSELEAVETKLREKETRIKKEIGNILTPEQQAKYMLFQQRFNREMREMVGKAKDMHKEMHQKRQPGKWRIF